MSKKKPIETLAERWNNNQGNSLLVIGFGLMILGMSVIRLQRHQEANRIPQPGSIGREVRNVGMPHLRLELLGLTNDKGVCVVEVLKPPLEGSRWLLAVGEKIQIGSKSLVWEPSLELGEYYATAFHDENENGMLDQTESVNEAFGFSNDAVGDWDSPDLQQAVFKVSPGKNLQRINLRAK